MKSLEDRDIADNTIIIFASDHGLLMGEYGMGGKGLLYDLTAKIPCFIYDPSLSESLRGQTIPELVSSLDITRTIVDYAGVEAPEEMEGSSLKPFVCGDHPEWRNELFLECMFTLRDNPFCEGIRVGKWKYIRMFDGVVHYNENDVDFSNRKPDFEQLFDLEKDPAEMENLIHDYEGSEILSLLRDKCSAYSKTKNQERIEYIKTHHCEPR